MEELKDITGSLFDINQLYGVDLNTSNLPFIELNPLFGIDLTTITQRRADGSYVITKDGLPYHVPNSKGYKELFKAVDEYVKANPEVVKVEYPYAPTLEDVRNNKFSELSEKFAVAEKDAHLTSSLGIVINAGEKANRDIEGLIKLMEAMPDMETADFCCYDNTETPVTLADLKTMQIEVILSGNALYQQKWAFRRAINAAKSKEDLEAIAIEFTYSDFSKGAGAE